MADRFKKKAASKNAEPFFIEGKMDISFFVILIALLVIGLIMLFSSSYAYALSVYGDSYKFIKRQFFFAVAGFGIMMFASKVNYHKYRKLAWPLYFISIALLALLLAMPPMISGMDCKRWIVVGPINFQPSEIAKFSIILLFSHLISSNYKKMDDFKFGVLFLGGLLAVVCGLVVVETHLSATLLIFVIGITLMIVGGLKKRYIVVGLAGGAALGGVSLLWLVGYASSRLQYWLDPWSDASGKGFQTIQSLLAIGSGGLVGRGLGQSRQKYLWIPEPHNDFIFAVICEELGFVGAMAIILLFCMLVWRGFSIAMKAADKFGSLLALGLTFQVGLQMILNVLVVTNTLPNTGISLPFFSYGGSSLVILLAEMGIVLSVSRGSSVEKL